MRTLSLLLLLVGLLQAPALRAEGVYVHGYTRSNGTYVQPHYRSKPDNSYNNNWSVQGNVNPYTGQEGTKPRRLYDTPSYGTGSGFGNYGIQPQHNVYPGLYDSDDDEDDSGD